MTAADLSHENLALLEAKLRADLETVMKVRALFKEHLGSAAQAGGMPGQSPQSVVGPPAATLAAPLEFRPTTASDVKVVVRDTVATFDGTFKIGMVKEQMRQQKQGGYPDTSIRSVLMRMVQNGELKIVHSAIGRGGSTFQRIKKEPVAKLDEPEPAAQ